MKSFVLRFSCFCLFFALALSVLPALGSTLTLSDLNSQVLIDTTSQSGVYSWTVDGVNQLAQQWFWYRIGSGRESSVDTLGAPTGGTTSANSATFSYAGSNGLTAQLKYALTGGNNGSGTADLGESITLTNTTGGTMDLHFFQYSDFDLAGQATKNFVQFINANTVDQYINTGGGTQVIVETVDTPAANRYEGNFFANTLNSLNDAGPTTLSNAPAIGVALGPGDMTWAYQWDRVLAPGGSLVINKDKLISTVPEPGTIALLAGGIFLLFGLPLRRVRRP
jgi:hypothetical protein